MDNINNLVKLCPICHSCLKKSVGEINEQKKIIFNILSSNKNAKEFASNFFNTIDDNDLIEEIYKKLK